MKRIAPTVVLLLLPIATGCQLIVPSAQRAEEVCIGPSPRWAGRLAGMPEFVPYENAESGPVAPRPKFHPLPTRPVFTPWKTESPFVETVDPVNPLLDDSGIPSDNSESIDVPPGFESGQNEDRLPRKDAATTLLNKSAAQSSRASSVRSASFGSASSRRSRWSEVRVVE